MALFEKPQQPTIDTVKTMYDGFIARLTAIRPKLQRVNSVTMRQQECLRGSNCCSPAVVHWAGVMTLMVIGFVALTAEILHLVLRDPIAGYFALGFMALDVFCWTVFVVLAAPSYYRTADAIYKFRNIPSMESVDEIERKCKVAKNLIGVDSDVLAHKYIDRMDWEVARLETNVNYMFDAIFSKLREEDGTAYLVPLDETHEVDV